jgi:subtilase family protein
MSDAVTKLYGSFASSVPTVNHLTDGSTFERFGLSIVAPSLLGAANDQLDLAQTSRCGRKERRRRRSSFRCSSTDFSICGCIGGAMNARTAAAGLTLFIGVLACPAIGYSQQRGSLPSIETQGAIKDLNVDKGTKRVFNFREYNVDVDKLPQGSKERIKTNADGTATTPLLIPDTMLIQFESNATKESIDSLLKRRGLTVVDTFPTLGAVKVQGDLTKYFAPILTDKSANDALLRGVNNVIVDFKSEPIVRSATPDVVLRTKSDGVANLLKASEVKNLIATAGVGAVDWGIANIEADKLWGMSGAGDGALFGVMDVGFARHEHIVFLEMPQNVAAEDHGNHVSGIACGRHDNAKGIKGVIPNCFVRAQTGDVFFHTAGDNPTLGFIVVFSQILASFERFLNRYDDIKVINLSMGYNWRTNFGINPDAPESGQWRTLVESQGTILVSALELADKRGKVIFSAAGNDSTGLAVPITAKYASPFNWAAITAREKGIAKNGIVVEAHGITNKRSAFSNTGGNMSCPGEDVLSAVAHDADGNLSEMMYGKMSGTSMASPYCAAALVLLGLVRPGYSGSELVDCMLASTKNSDTGLPIPQLSQAIMKCPAR